MLFFEKSEILIFPKIGEGISKLAKADFQNWRTKLAKMPSDFFRASRETLRCLLCWSIIHVFEFPAPTMHPSLSDMILVQISFFIHQLRIDS